MKLARPVLAAACLITVSLLLPVQAQEEMDFEALLQDFDVEASETQELPDESVVEAVPPSEDFVADLELQEVSDMSEAAVDATPAPSDEMDTGLDALSDMMEAFAAPDDEVVIEPLTDDGLGVPEETLGLTDEIDAPLEFTAEDEEALEEYSNGFHDDLNEPVPMDPPEALEVLAVSETVEEIEIIDEMTDDSDQKATQEDTAAAKSIAKAFSYNEEVRRQAMEVRGLELLEDGYRHLQDKKYDPAAKSFEKAVGLIPLRPATEVQLEQARWGLAEANYRQAKILAGREDLAAARDKIASVLKAQPDHKGALRLRNKIDKLLALPPERIPVRELPDTIERAGKVDDYLKFGEEYFWLGDYTRAKQYFDSALAQDEYNKKAMRFLKKIAELKFRRSTLERDATSEDMIQQVRDTWNPPTREIAVSPAAELQTRVVPGMTETQQLEARMSRIIIPSIEFRQVNIQDVVNFLVQASIEGDVDGIGVNIILNLNMGGAGDSMQAGLDQTFDEPDLFGEDEFGGEFDDFLEPAPAAPASANRSPQYSGVPSITLNLRRVSLLDSIRYITDVANLKFRVDKNVVVITPAGVVSERIISSIYPVQPSIVDVIVEKDAMDASERTGEFVEIGGRSTNFQRGDMKEFFQKAGVPFPNGTSIVYNPAISSLIVANTQENLEVFERILSQLNVLPSQVEIEARFVEVAQSDMQELGLEWLFTDNVELFEEKGPGPIATKKRVQLNADAEGASKGLRFFGEGANDAIDRLSTGANAAPNFFGNLLSFSGVLTNPELTVVLHALDQSGNVDVLSAPRVTTKTGLNAIIEVVEEIIYPTEFETNVQTLSGGEGVQDRQIVTVTPGSFETRETGVILNVTPTVGPDGYTIELVLAPEVAELVDWIDYGYTFEGTEVNIPQPVFASRNVTTSIVIWDGQTVVMGGLITERMVTIEDKIPLLGDIPILGRLFRNEGEQSSKRNLLIFVTARIVDPSGNPVHQADQLALPGSSVAAEALSTSP